MFNMGASGCEHWIFLGDNAFFVGLMVATGCVDGVCGVVDGGNGLRG